MNARREFMKLVVSSPMIGFGKKGIRNKRRHHKHTQLYHGPMTLPEQVVKMAERNPYEVKTTHRHFAIKVSHENISYLFRTLGGHHYIGEIVQTQEGNIRVHVWSIAAGPFQTVQQIIDSKLHGIPYTKPDKYQGCEYDY